MSQPVVVTVSPNVNATGVVLGSPVVLTFDQVLNTATVNAGTFSLSGPGTTSVVDATSLITQSTGAYQGIEYVPGSFAFTTNSSSQTVATFTPSVTLRPNVTYTVLIAGADSAISSQVIANPGGEVMAANYVYRFTTGNLDLISPPTSSPIPFTRKIDPDCIQVVPVMGNGNDPYAAARYSNREGGALISSSYPATTYNPSTGYTTDSAVDTTQITGVNIIFPSAIDSTSFTTNQILVAIAPVLQDYGFAIPSQPNPTVTISGNVIAITFPGWSQ